MPAPTVSSVSPPTGIVTGGTVCIIIGTNFTGSTAVTFGGTNATSFSVISATRIYAIAPPHAAGAVNVVVTNPSGSGTGTNAFTFAAAANPAYNLYLFDESCHIWISTNTGGTFLEGCTPGNADTPAPNDPGLDPHGFGTIRDDWIDGQMAINDGDYTTFAGLDQVYNDEVGDGYGIIGTSLSAGMNGTWTLIDPELNEPAFVSSPDSSQEYTRLAISGNAETILLTTLTGFVDPDEDLYPRISYDQGATWANVTGVEPNIRWLLACFGSTASQIMYMQPKSGTNGIFPAYIRKSTDWGVTWSALTNGPDELVDAGPSAARLRCSADGQTIIRIYKTGDFWISQDGGDTWTNISLTSDFSFTSSNRFADCGISPDGETIILSTEQTLNAGFWPAVFVSTDGGDNFTNVTGNLQYPSTIGAPAGGAPGTTATGCTQCNVAPDGLGMVVTFNYTDPGITEPDGLTGRVIYANVSIDAGATFKLVSFDADPYENLSTVGAFTGIYITPSSSVSPPPVGSGRRWFANPGPARTLT